MESVQFLTAVDRSLDSEIGNGHGHAINFRPFRYFSRGNGGSEAGNERVVDESRLDESIIEGHRSYRRNRESSSSSEVKNYGAIIRVRLEPRSCRSPLVCAARFREEERVGQGR